MLYYKNLKSIVKSLLIIFDNPLKAFVLSFFIYFCLSFLKGVPWGVSEFPYFNYLADAFLHGQLNLRLLPPSTHDLILFEDNFFLYWPPLPAILSMPFVALFGINFSDILFTIIVGCINVGLLASLLRKTEIIFHNNLNELKRAMLVICFAFGSSYLILVPIGRVWSTSIVIGVTCTLVIYHMAITKEGTLAFFLTGLAVSAAILTRMHLFLIGIWPAWYLISRHLNLPKKQLIKNMFVGILPILITITLFGAYNFVRFGDVFDIGYSYHNMSVFFRNDYMIYGGFDLHYVPINFFYQYIAYPFFAQTSIEFFMGGSVFLLSPLFFGIFSSFRDKRNTISKIYILITIIFTSVPILLLMGTGFVQFGARYTLDFIVPLVLLTSEGIKNWTNKVVAILLIISILHFAIGFLIYIKFA